MCDRLSPVSPGPSSFVMASFGAELLSSGGLLEPLESE
jgi:hypothetical protein